MPETTDAVRIGVAKLLRSRLDRQEHARLREVARHASAAGERAFLVGGVVRDLLLSRKTHDLDVAVTGSAEAIARAVADNDPAGKATVTLHPRFLTATVSFADGFRLDIATTRRERYRRPAQLPDVEPAGLHEDLARRDFTINAMALALGSRREGRWIDPHDGAADLERRRLRALHERSYHDDPTRAFRLARYAARLGFRESATDRRWIQEALRAGAFDRLSRSRLRVELHKLLGDRMPSAGVRNLDRLGVSAVVASGLRISRPLVSRLRRVDSLDGNELKAPVDRLGARIALIGADLSRPRRAELASWAYPGRQQQALVVDGPTRARRLARSLATASLESPSRLDRRCARERAEVVLMAVALAEDPLARARGRRYLVDLAGRFPVLRAPDLLKAGIPQGPAIAAGLAAARAAALDGRARTAAEELSAGLRAARRALESRRR